MVKVQDEEEAVVGKRSHLYQYLDNLTFDSGRLFTHVPKCISVLLVDGQPSGLLIGN